MNRSKDPVERLLRRVTRPGRYAGGEFGSIVKSDARLFRVGISYPDLYEIGMANVAVKTLYGLANALQNVACERVFAPDMDMEQALRASGIPLFTLETRTPLTNLDVLGFSLGYELTLTNMLNIIDLGGIALRAVDRGGTDPIVVTGGPLSGNPAPYGPFVDAVFVGEGEEWVEQTLPRLAEMKRQGSSRQELLDVITADAAVWTEHSQRPVRRAIWRGFGLGPRAAVGNPVPSIKIVQDNGTVEIMRGCPTGCRFCHAGIYYRPTRVKQPRDVAYEVDQLINHCGYHEITLSSLSSADYRGLVPLVRGLNAQYADRGISFSLPSLKVESVGLDLFTEIARVRRSGLTFALETPGRQGQRAINKEISPSKTISILREARARGWRSAKFYFMIGLPVPDADGEVAGIIDLMREAHRETGVYMHVNVATFIPKPHTPYQWAPQLSEETALERIMTIRQTLPRSGFKVGYHSPFTSMMEGIVARGDGRVAALIEEGFRQGARFDAWEEHIERDTWRSIIGDADWDVVTESLGARDLGQDLPWDNVQVGATKGFLKKEWDKSILGELTPACAGDCSNPCGVCSKDFGVRDSVEEPFVPTVDPPLDPNRWVRFLLCLSKTEEARFLSHLDLMGVLERSARRGGLRLRMTQGHNPKPRIEFASPLALGVSSSGEMVSMDVHDPTECEPLRVALQGGLPAGIRVEEIALIPMVEGQKRRSLASIYWGSDFILHGEDTLLKQARRGLQEEEGVTVVSMSQRSLHIRHKHKAEKGSGILPTLRRALGKDFLVEDLDVHRENQLASAGDEGAAVPFFDLLIPPS